jgi:uncharacterized surface protein with fasciclin (FAS1) repeats
MQNAVIIGGIAILLIGGFIFVNNSSNTTDSVTTDVVAVETMEETNDTPTMEDDMMEPEPDIVTTAVNTPALSTLVAAVTAAELVETLQGPGPFTVFAPTNEAFAALPDGTLETLLDPANIGQLQGILTYHVVPGAVMAGDLTDGMVVQTVNGESITINVSEAGVSINGSANVAMADIVTSNGIVHVIDSVLLPTAE